MTTITVQKPAVVRVPRAAPIAAALFAKLIAIWEQTLTSRREAKVVASRAAEAEEVRRYAETVRKADPRFAADLFAAADRHEMGN